MENADNKRVGSRAGQCFYLNLPVQGLSCLFYDGIVPIPPQTRNIMPIYSNRELKLLIRILKSILKT